MAGRACSWRHVLAGLALLLLVPPGVYALTALLLGLLPQHRGFVSVEGGIPIHVISSGVHADIVLPVLTDQMDWSHEFPPGHFRYLPELPSHISFGWGDRGFYFNTPYWSDLTLDTAFLALSGLGSTVMHVEYLYAPPPGPHTAQVRLTDEQYCLLVQQIRASFRRNAAGDPLLFPGRGYFDTDAFYAAVGRFSLFTTCNDWVRQTLAAAGVRTPHWAPFSRPLLWQLRAAGRTETLPLESDP